MKRIRSRLLLMLVAMLMISAVAVAQRRRYGYGGGWDRDFRPETVDRGGVPEWENDARFKHDVFTFVRIRYSDGWGRSRRGKWATDYPDADLNFSYRLHELTSIETDPHGKILDLTDPELLDYPFIYVIEPGDMLLSEEEVLALRKYLLSGGFMMVDDFWGRQEWDNFYREIKRVFPQYEPVELPLAHEIFHCVYDLQQKPQIPSIHGPWDQGYMTDRPWDPTAREVGYYGLFDDKGRMMAIICHNTDVGDGWEREGLDPRYFQQFSEKWSYPMGINIVTYAMTH